jgi:hypothetical protein
MVKMIQLDFFEQDENLILKDNFRKLKESSERQRKALFARNGELHKKIDDLTARIEILERYICRNGERE